MDAVFSELLPHIATDELVIEIVFFIFLIRKLNTAITQVPGPLDIILDGAWVRRDVKNQVVIVANMMFCFSFPIDAYGRGLGISSNSII
jgi:hypothetical protein